MSRAAEKLVSSSGGVALRQKAVLLNEMMTGVDRCELVVYEGVMLINDRDAEERKVLGYG